SMGLPWRDVRLRRAGGERHPASRLPCGRWRSAGLRPRSPKRGSSECPRRGHTTPPLSRGLPSFSLTQIVADTRAEDGAASDGAPLSGSTLGGGVELAADQCDEGDQIHPDEQRNDCTDGAVHHVVTGQVAYVPGESQRGEEPQGRGQGGSGPDIMPALFAVWAEVVER